MIHFCRIQFRDGRQIMSWSTPKFIDMLNLPQKGSGYPHPQDSQDITFEPRVSGQDVLSKKSHHGFASSVVIWKELFNCVTALGKCSEIFRPPLFPGSNAILTRYRRRVQLLQYREHYIIPCCSIQNAV